VRGVPRVTFTSNLARLVDAPALFVSGTTVRQALDAVFARNPKLRGYVLDDQGALRRHVIVFVGGEAVADRTRLTDPVEEKSEISVLQALSGG
jgi:sulfur carrier protein ThiS